MRARAELVRQLPTTNAGADQRLYRCRGGGLPHLVVTSAVVTLQAHGFGPETYIFAANESGDITNWCELPGSFKGGLDHVEALRRAGYEVAS